MLLFEQRQETSIFFRTTGTGVSTSFSLFDDSARKLNNPENDSREKDRPGQTMDLPKNHPKQSISFPAKKTGMELARVLEPSLDLEIKEALVPSESEFLPFAPRGGKSLIRARGSKSQISPGEGTRQSLSKAD
ncbi:unnamed protein product [Ilex paraguariensis]|uniref:Uncharacterized protein n=1 Tax=Ilex paraguariensis TaxID=185542 RepID=A0ABC8U395_9AQUA